MSEDRKPEHAKAGSEKMEKRGGENDQNTSNQRPAAPGGSGSGNTPKKNDK
ncbi:MAG: hypothetical protein J0M17_17845 [Planctomycetes bacterium]|nr:hypothetical protein [Planctomycetota bacterium]